MNQSSSENIVQQLKNGIALLKCKANGKKYQREFYLDENETFLSYRGSRKIFKSARVYEIKDIDEIRQGFRAETFGRLARKGLIRKCDENRAFTVIYNNHRSELHLLARNSQICKLWVEVLHDLVTKNAAKSQRHLIKEENWILSHFYSADKDNSNSLSKKECRQLLKESFHVELPDNFFENIFRQADQSREGLLSPDEFLRFFNLLTQRRELYEIMQKHTKNGFQQKMERIHFTQEELLEFLDKVQRQTIRSNRSEKNFKFEYVSTIEQVQSLIDEFELDKKSREQRILTLDGFRNMMLSEDFSIAKAMFSHQVYQDMTRPLCDYFINTSHNTYLFYSQISGDSNPEAYNRVLLNGCRAVELDCHDGDNGEPIVTHAYTFVKPCSFKSIIRYIEPNLFKTSPYPVILNIENHCSIEQEKQIMRILKRFLGDRLAVRPSFSDENVLLPSPEDLKFKVLIRCKKNSKANKSNVSSNCEDEMRIPKRNSTKINKKQSNDEENDLIPFLLNVPFLSDSEARRNYLPFHSSSLGEGRLEKLMTEDPQNLTLQTSWRIIRAYPGGLRQGSSNMNPIQPWNYGVQMVALNQQNDDDIMPLSYGKFLDNGGCGYILKPDHLINHSRNKISSVNSNPEVYSTMIINLTIITAQFLSKSSLNTSDVPDPYVIVAIHGLPRDEQSYQTKTIANNGLNPRWNEQCTFRIQYPQMALIHFSVYDADRFTRDDKLGQFCLPVLMIQSGYRHIHLRGKHNDPIHSTIFVHVDIHDDSDDIVHVSL